MPSNFGVFTINSMATSRVNCTHPPDYYWSCPCRPLSSSSLCLVLVVPLPSRPSSSSSLFHVVPRPHRPLSSSSLVLAVPIPILPRSSPTYSLIPCTRRPFSSSSSSLFQIVLVHIVPLPRRPSSTLSLVLVVPLPSCPLSTSSLVHIIPAIVDC